MNSILKNAFLLTLMINNLFYCSAIEDPEKKEIYSPIITGIYETTISAPYGTGTIYGNPAYSVGDSAIPLNTINVCPNPYLGMHLRETNRYDKFLIIFNLPDSIDIEIYKSIFKRESEVLMKTTSGATDPLRTIIKRDTHRSFYYWNLKDDNNNYIETGFYSLFFYDNKGNTHRVDAYIILPDGISACSDWDDPTGWLDENWRFLNINEGSTAHFIYRCACVTDY